MITKPEAKNILVIKHGALGDIIQADGAFQDIRENYPDARITVMSEPAYTKYFARCPWVDDIFEDPRPSRWHLPAMAKLRKRIRAAQFDFVIDLQNNGRSGSYFRFLFPKTPWSGIVRGASHRRRSKDPNKIIGLPRYQTQLQEAGLTTKHAIAPNISWLAEDVSDLLAQYGLTDQPYIFLVPGSSAQHVVKRWPHYKELITKLEADGYKTVTCPGPDDVELCKTLPSVMIQGDPYLDWPALAGLMKSASFVVGNDTGPVHLAAHMNQITVALFGRYFPAYKSGIHRANVQVLEVDDLSNLPVQEVYAAAGNLLKNYRAEPVS